MQQLKIIISSLCAACFTGVGVAADLPKLGVQTPDASTVYGRCLQACQKETRGQFQSGAQDARSTSYSKGKYKDRQQSGQGLSSNSLAKTELSCSEKCTDEAGAKVDAGSAVIERGNKLRQSKSKDQSPPVPATDDLNSVTDDPATNDSDATLEDKDPSAASEG